MRISDWSSDVCSSDLAGIRMLGPNCLGFANFVAGTPIWTTQLRRASGTLQVAIVSQSGALARSEEHTSELQSLMRISYAVFCLKKKKQKKKDRQKKQ